MSPKPISLSDAQFAAVMAAAGLLSRQDVEGCPRPLVTLQPVGPLG
jgi:hypothetical protein